MMCRCQLPLRKLVRHKAHLRITGTFDFRWPRGSTIRVAFQDCQNSKALPKLVDKVREAFEAWGVGKVIRADGPNLAYAIVQELFPAGGQVTQDLLQEEADRVRQITAAEMRDRKAVAQLAGDAERFAAVAAHATEAGPSNAAHLAGVGAAVLDYDVLISFAPMPVVIPGSDFLENAARALVYAQSDLGSYAKREDLGLPTSYLGRPSTFKVDQEVGDLDLAWLNSSEGTFTIMHEVGHILGLAHEHQNPKRHLTEKVYRPYPQILEILTLREMAPIYHDFIERELTTPFADPEGSQTFSQWRDPTDAERAGGPIGSVMVEPIYRCMLLYREANHDCLRQADCLFEDAYYDQLQHPTDSDRRQLLQLYRP
jgi:hypothetical protein